MCKLASEKVQHSVWNSHMTTTKYISGFCVCQLVWAEHKRTLKFSTALLNTRKQSEKLRIPTGLTCDVLPSGRYLLAYKGSSWYVLKCTDAPALLTGPEDLEFGPRKTKLFFHFSHKVDTHSYTRCATDQIHTSPYQTMYDCSTRC